MISSSSNIHGCGKTSLKGRLLANSQYHVLPAHPTIQLSQNQFNYIWRNFHTSYKLKPAPGAAPVGLLQPEKDEEFESVDDDDDGPSVDDDDFEFNPEAFLQIWKKKKKLALNK